jgi:hypothetical protein
MDPWLVVSLIEAITLVSFVVAYERLRIRARTGDKAITRIIEDAFVPYVDPPLDEPAGT